MVDRKQNYDLVKLDRSGTWVYDRVSSTGMSMKVSDGELIGAQKAFEVQDSENGVCVQQYMSVPVMVLRFAMRLKKDSTRTLILA